MRPERVYVWRGGDFAREPQLFDSRMEEVRSAHSEEPAVPQPAPPSGGPPPGTSACDELGRRHETAVLSVVAPDGFPMSARVPIEPDEAAGASGSESCRRHAARRRPRVPGRARARSGLQWQINFQVRGDLVPEDGGWALVPHKLVGGFELPPAATRSATG